MFPAFSPKITMILSESAPLDNRVSAVGSGTDDGLQHSRRQRSTPQGWAGSCALDDVTGRTAGKRSLANGKSFEDSKQLRPSPPNSIRASRLAACTNRPDIRLQPDLKRHHQTSLAKPGGVHISRSDTCGHSRGRNYPKRGR